MKLALFMPGLRPQSLGWQIYQDLAESIRKRGHAFEIVTTGVEPSAGPVAGTTVLPVPKGTVLLSRAGAPLLRVQSLVPATIGLARHLRSSPPDVLHVEVAYPFATAAALAARLARWRGILGVTPMGEDVLVVEEAAYGFRRFRVPRRLVTWTLRQANVVRAISPLVEELLRQEWPGLAVRTFPLNVSKRTLASRSDRAAARAAVGDRYGLPEGPVVVSLGRLHPFKGLDTLVDAAGQLSGATVAIAGPALRVAPFGDTGEWLARLARDRGVAERIRFLGPVPPEETATLLAAADVVVIPSRLESMNRVAIEAAAAGTPLVVTTTTGITGWMPDDGVGLRVPPRDPGALAAAVRRVLEGAWRPDRDELARFASRFSSDRIGGEMVKLYETVATESVRR